MPTKHKYVKVTLPDEQVEQLHQVAEQKGLTVSELIRQLLVKHKLISKPNVRKWDVSQNQE